MVGQHLNRRRYDYYGNLDNDGHIMFALFNVKDEDTTEGDGIGASGRQAKKVLDLCKVERKLKCKVERKLKNLCQSFLKMS